MKFLKPLYPNISIEPPVYSDGILQEAHPDPLQSMAHLFSEGLSKIQADLYTNYIHNHDIQSLSNNHIQKCISHIASAMESHIGLYFVTFRNTENGCRPFLLSKPDDGPPSLSFQNMVMQAAVIAARMGLMLEFCKEVVQRYPELQPVYEKAREVGNVTLIAIPYVQGELHGVFVGIRFCEVPLTDHAWARLFTCLETGMKPFLEARSLRKVPDYDPQPLVPRNDNRKWDDGVRVLNRDRVIEMVQKMPDAAKCCSLLQRCNYYLGFGDPRHLHPKRLYRKLQTTQDVAAIAMTEETLKMSTELSSSVISQSCADALHSVFSGVTAVIPDAEKVFFVTLLASQMFKIAHDISDFLTLDERVAIGAVAQWTALFGEAIFDTSADRRTVFNHLRALARCDVPIVSIPVYSWEVGKKGMPSLHGVLVALRHPDAPIPPHATQLAWALAAQYLLSPLSVAVKGDRTLYGPVNIGDNLREAYRHPDFPSKPDIEALTAEFRARNLKDEDFDFDDGIG